LVQLERTAQLMIKRGYHTNNTRAYMYYRCLQTNFAYLSTIFSIMGIKYYIRMLREAADGNCDLDTDDIRAAPKKISANEPIRIEKLYNYFIFKSKLTKTAAQIILRK